MATTPAHESKERVSSIDGLRGTAALGVVLYHYSSFFDVHAIPTGAISRAILGLFRFGHLGVEIFFVLSGYVIAMTGARYVFTRKVAERFLLRRLVRLVPPYWGMIGLVLGTYLLGRSLGAFREARMTAGQVLSHLFYAQNILGYPPLDVAYWTLCLEVQFYFVFALSAWLMHRSSPTRAGLWFLALTVGSLLVERYDLVPGAFCPRYWYRFGMGVLAYQAVGSKPLSTLLGLMVALLLGLGAARGEASLIAVAVAASALWGIARFPGRFDRCPSLLVKLGTISYSLYLVHGYWTNFLGAVFRSPRSRTELAAWFLVILFTAIAIGFAAVFYRVCELRAIAWSRKVRIKT